MALPRRIRHRARSIRIPICEAFYIFRHFDFCDFSLPLLARFACALRSLFDSSHPVPLFSMRSGRRLSSVCDPFKMIEDALRAKYRRPLLWGPLLDCWAKAASNVGRPNI